jgi:membrane dipeptidase
LVANSLTGCIEVIIQVSSAASSTSQKLGEARRIHADATIVLGHDHMRCGTDAADLIKGGITAKIYSPISAADVNISADFLSTIYDCSDWSKRAMLAIAEMYDDIEENHDKLLLALSPSDVERAKREQKIAIILSLEGGKPLEGRLELLKIYHKLGLRSFQLVWSYRNQLGDGGMEPAAAGLTELGREVIRELNRLGIICDLAHISEKGFQEAVEISKNPVFVSHSGARALCNVPQHLTDQQLKMLEDNGGLCGVIFYKEQVRGPEATIEDLVDHIDYISSKIGVEHVGLGPDFFLADQAMEAFMKAQFDNPIWPPPFVIPNPSEMLQVTSGLLERGYSEKDIRKVLGGNFMRIFSKTSKS